MILGCRSSQRTKVRIIGVESQSEGMTVMVSDRKCNSTNHVLSSTLGGHSYMKLSSIYKGLVAVPN